MSTLQAPLKQRLRDHVTSRLPGAEPVIRNGAWQMMLDAADEIDQLEKIIRLQRRENIWRERLARYGVA